MPQPVERRSSSSSCAADKTYDEATSRDLGFIIGFADFGTRGKGSSVVDKEVVQ